MDIAKEIKKDEEIIEKAVKKTLLKAEHYQSIFGIVFILLLLGGFIFWRTNWKQVKTDKASINAPIIQLSPTGSGILYEVYVKEGDHVEANTPIAKVGDEIITSKVSGTIVSVNHQEGQVFIGGFPGGTPVATMTNEREERLVGKIDEDKGLSKIAVGNLATFTVDAFGGKEYQGVVDEVSPISSQSGIVFNISDQREIKQFDVKIKFNLKDYPELRVGMSAKMTVFVK